ncbi:MAG: response regulator transcription factor [Bacteroidales bacterium]
MIEQPKPRILYVEDDEALSYVTRDNLEMYGFEITWCKDGMEGWRAFHKAPFDLCVLDVMLPETDGFELARKIRRVNTDIPIIFLTARTMKEDRLEGLRLGADDYITKPFSIEELQLKINVFLQRPKKAAPAVQLSVEELGGFVFDIDNKVLKYGKSEVKLTLREAELLAFLIRNRNKTVGREDILDAVWKNSDFFISRSLDVFISRLRKYLRADPSITIENVHGIGFKLKIAPQA